MDIRVLQYFLTVAREQSISSAVEMLHITQPPLSWQLIDLENELGKQLFIRGNRKIVLTEEGRILRKQAEEIIGPCSLQNEKGQGQPGSPLASRYSRSYLSIWRSTRKNGPSSRKAHSH